MVISSWNWTEETWTRLVMAYKFPECKLIRSKWIEWICFLRKWNFRLIQWPIIPWKITIGILYFQYRSQRFTNLQNTYAYTKLYSNWIVRTDDYNNLDWYIIEKYFELNFYLKFSNHFMVQPTLYVIDYWEIWKYFSFSFCLQQIKLPKNFLVALSFSTPLTILSGVSQDSVLGLLLFLAYTVVCIYSPMTFHHIIGTQLGIFTVQMSISIEIFMV